MTCLVDQGASSAALLTDSYPLTWAAVVGGSSATATPTSTASTSASSAADARPSSNPAKTRVSRSGARFVDGVYQRKPCERCGGEKPAGKSRRLCEECQSEQAARDAVKGVCRGCGDQPVSHRRARYCDECRALQYEAAQARKRAQERAQRRPCKGCGRVKPPGRAREYCDACQRRRSGPRTCERCPNPARHPRAKLCAECRAQADRAAREYQRRWHERQPTARSGPQMSKASQRMANRLKAEQKGRTLELAPSIMIKTGGDGSGERRVDSASFPGLPVAPFVAMIERLIVKERAKLYELALVTMDVSDGAQGTVCVRLGVATRRLNVWREWMRRDAALIGPRLANGRFSRHWGEGASVSFDVADGALSAAGLLWFDVWPSDAICTNGRSVEWVFTTTELLADAA